MATVTNITLKGPKFLTANDHQPNNIQIKGIRIKIPNSIKTAKHITTSTFIGIIPQSPICPNSK
jgi:hypothetical protein